MNKETITTVLLLGIINILISSDVTNAYPLMLPANQNDHTVTRLPRSIDSQDTVEDCRALDIVFVLDASENVLREHWNQILSNIINVTIRSSEQIEDVRLSLVRFSTTSDILFNLGAYSSIYNSLYMINGTQYVGEKSNLAHGLRDAKYIIEAQPATRRFAQDVVVVISDGKQNEAEDQLDYWLNELKNTDAEIFSFPVTSNFDEDLLNKISSSPSHVITSNDSRTQFIPQLIDLAYTDCVIDPEVPSLQCPGEGSGNYPFNDNCESYVVCEDYGTESAKTTIMSCPAGLLFNSNIKVCDWPYNVPECIQNSQSSTSEEITSTTETSSNGNEPTPNNPSSTEELVCPGQIDGYYSDPASCEYYYACNLDVVYHMKCPNGLYFDIYTKVCNHSYLVPDCGQANIIP